MSRPSDRDETLPEDEPEPRAARTLGDELERRYGRGVDPELTLSEAGAHSRSSDSGQGGTPLPVEEHGAPVHSSNPSARYSGGTEIARGGMGAILQVWDRDLRRRLAMKVSLLSGPGESRSGTRLAVERFLEEAQITGQLDHPGVVPVHDLGLDEKGRLFFTMKLVRGFDLREVFRRRSESREEWSQTRCLGILLKVCEAVAYAHDKGVIHRDLKPANVMVGHYGEVYVMDWGLARLSGDNQGTIQTKRHEIRESGGSSPLLTAEGAVIGTPYYMPPEQAGAAPERVGPWSDVYAVGAILYELLAQRPPYADAQDAQQVLEQLRQGPPNALDPGATGSPPELIAICSKAMDRSPLARYRSMGELAEDLRRFLEGRVVQAYRTGAGVELRKWVQRNRGMAAASLAALLFLFVGLTSILVLESRSASRERASRRTIESSNEQLAEANSRIDARSRELEQLNDELQRTNTDLEDARETAEDQAAEARRERDAASAVSSFLVHLFEAPNPYHNPGQEISAQDLLLAGSKSALEMGGDPGVQRRVLTAIGDALASLGADVEAEPVLVRLLELCVAELGEENTETLSARTKLARSHRRQGRFVRAEQMFASLLAHWRERGDDETALMSALNSHAAALRELGELETAELEYREAVERAEAHFGARHPQTLIYKGNLGSLLGERGDPAAALAMAREVYEGSRTAHAPEHPDRILAAINLASRLEDAGEIQQAIELQEETLAIGLPVLGPSHPWISNLYNNQGTTLQQVGRLDEAASCYEKAIAGREQRYGEGDVNRLTMLNNYGRLLLQLGRPEEAVDLFEESLDSMQRHRPERRPWIRQTHGLLAGALRAAERGEEAIAVLERELELCHQLEAADVHEVHHQLAMLCEQLGHIDEAETHVRAVLATARSNLGDEAPTTTLARLSLGRFLIEYGKPQEALRYVQRVIETESADAEVVTLARALRARAQRAPDDG